jgi:hypothetical protein
MRRYIVPLAWIMAGVIIFTWLYVENIYPLDLAIGYISRAQAAGYAEDAAQYLRQALPLIPSTGNPVWIFPTSRTDFQLIHKDLDGILGRLSVISGLASDMSAYSQALNDIRGRLAVIVGHIGEAMPYTILSPANLGIFLIWILSLPAAYRLRAYLRMRSPLKAVQ